MIQKFVGGSRNVKWLEGAVIGKMTESSFAHLIQACTRFDQKVRK